MLVGAATVVTVTNIAASMAYYRDALGFDVAFDYGEPTFYVGLCRDEVTLHLRAAAQQPSWVAGNGAVAISTPCTMNSPCAAPALSSRRRITPMACATLTLTISTAIA